MCVIHCVSQTISIPGRLDGATFWGDSQSSLCISARFFCSAASTSLFFGFVSAHSVGDRPSSECLPPLSFCRHYLPRGDS